MSTAAEASHLLLWKGRQAGPFPLAAIREMLQAGEISRVHQIQSRGRWLLLDEFLEKAHPSSGQRLLTPGGRSALSHLLPAPASGGETLAELELPAFPRPAPTRTSRLAIAALALSLANFIPYLDAVTWIGALACGHLALVRMEEDGTLGGRGLALAGLALTYFLLIVVITFAVLMLANGRALF